MFLAENAFSDSLGRRLPDMPGAFDWVQIGLLLVGGFFIIAASVRALDAFFERRNFDHLAFRPVRGLVKWLGVLIIISLILGKFGFNVLTALSTILALIAVGFVAVWSVLSNFLCTFLLIFFRPFSINDRIEFPGDEVVRGRVVELTAFYTVLEDEDGGLLHIPNNHFFQKSFKKLGPKKTEPENPSPPAA